jgi:hypothetical protein
MLRFICHSHIVLHLNTWARRNRNLEFGIANMVNFYWATALAFLAFGSFPSICALSTIARPRFEFSPSLWSTALLFFANLSIFYCIFTSAPFLIVKSTGNPFPQHICEITTAQMAIRNSGRSLYLGIITERFFPPKSTVLWIIAGHAQTQFGLPYNPPKNIWFRLG